MNVTIAAVGDLLMKSEIIASAKQSGVPKFDPIFAEAAPYLRKHDVVIGNLETTFSGKRLLGISGIRLKCNCPRERRNARTGYPVFNCPDELAATLKKAGFTVLTTANNHCMDGGAAGLTRTLKILDQYRLHHTGTFRSLEEFRRNLILRVKGIRIGILNYTEGTNDIPVPEPWLVNRIERNKMVADIRKLKQKADFIIVCLHFGREYQPAPGIPQKQLIDLLFRQGANVVLGTHPHVLHPVRVHKIKDIDGQVRTRVAASSLGNFVSTRLQRNNSTIRGMILSLALAKNEQGITDIVSVKQIPTIMERGKQKKMNVYRVMPVK